MLTNELQTLSCISETYAQFKYIADPHTAVGLAGAKTVAAHKSKEVVQVVLSTAHPAKFSEAVTRALCNIQGFNFDRDVLPEEFKGLLKKERRVIDAEKSVDAVKDIINNRESGKKVKEISVSV